MAKIISIAAVHAETLGIGCQGKLLYDLPQDMARFYKLTTGHTVVMGYNTYKSMGRPLPNRMNFVVSRKAANMPEFWKDGRVSFHSDLHTLLQRLKHTGDKDKKVFIIGGEQVYNSAMPFVDEILLTLVFRDWDVQADTFFPKIGPNFFFSHDIPENGYPDKDCSYVRYVRKELADKSSFPGV